MSIIYNEEGALYRKDSEYYDKLSSQELNAFNVVGRTQEMQTERFFQEFTTTGTSTLTQDVIITSIVINLTGREGGAATASATFEAEINSVTIHRLSLTVEGGLTSTGATNLIIPIPNWLLKSGDILGATLTNALDTINASLSFIGFIA